MTDRTPDALLGLAYALDVEHLPCMQPCQLMDRGTLINVTRCSDYAKVFMAALGCPLPVGMTANELFDWLGSTAAALQGWQACEVETAVQRSNLGYPVVAVAQEEGHGHIAVGIPGPAEDLGHLYVSAAGGQNRVRCKVEQTFGLQLHPLTWTHN